MAGQGKGKLVLEIGGNIKPQWQYVFGDQATIETLDGDEQFKPTYVADCRMMPEELYGRFDGILASHVLEHVEYRIVHPVVAGWARCMKIGGELHIVVPSFEWTAKQVLKENPSKALMGHTFGGQTTPWDYHYCMFTMRLLRYVIEKAGMNVVRARSGDYHLRSPEGKIVVAEQHYVMGVKVSEVADTEVLHARETGEELEEVPPITT